MAAKKEVEKAVKYKEFQRTVDKLLTPEDQDYLFYALKEYNTYKSVGKLMLALNSCLDSAEKLDLLPYIRDLIPKHDKKRFDHLAPYNRMAHPIQLGAVSGAISSNGTESTGKVNRVVNLQRTSHSPSLGFSIRGGQEHELGIYVSHVESLSQAEKSGLQVGDKLIRVNGIDFERVSHSSAVLVLKSHDNLKIEVKNVGKVPGQTLARSAFVWVDPQGRPVEESEERVPGRARHSIRRDERSPDRLLSSPDKHKIVLHSSKKRSLGFSIRGGSEYGLGIYISVVDLGSLSEEAGLQVGDQVLDINGHSFLSILHFEAVHILKSYTTLIMTIKSLGRIPTLKQNGVTENGLTLEQSPITRRKSTEFVRTGSLPPPARTSKRPSSATIEEEEEEPEPDDVPVRKPSSSLKRSESARQQRASATAGFDDIDSPMKLRSNSFGSGSPNFSGQRASTKRHMILSPLATHETRASTASPSPVSSPDSGSNGSNSPFKVKSKFFEKGLGTQVMLANVSSQAKQLLFDKARRVLSEEGVEILREDLIQYEETSNVDQFVDCLLSIFNTPEKMELLRDVRSVVKPTDIVRFDEKVSPHELRTFREKNLSEEDSDDDFDFDSTFDTDDRDDDEDPNANPVVLTGVLKRNGHIKPFSSDTASLTLQETSPFSLRAKKTGSTASAPDLSEVQNMETKLSWNNNSNNNNNNNGSNSGSDSGSNSSGEVNARSYGTDQPQRHRHIPEPITLPQGNPVFIDVNKEAPYIGLAIRTTPENHVLVKDVREGGAIHRDGFIKPGFEIIQVDNIRIRGKSYHDAAREIADAFKSEGPTVRFIVVPNYA